jgi:hypothetical protein
MIRQFLKRAGTVALVLGIFGIFLRASGAETFVHPGLLQSGEDLGRMKAAVAAKSEPVFSGYEIFRASAQSQADYKMRGPLAMVGRNPTVGQGAYDSDASAAYQCAIMWCLTGDIAYANKSKEIVNAWSATLKSITGRDAILMAGLGPFKMVNAAEILRYTDAGWSPAEIQQTEKHFREVIYPVIQDFAPFANGNWDTASVKTMMAIGVFCNDRGMYERALDYYVNGAGDGRLAHYIINATGQCQESGRDQQHTQLGLAHLGDCCEITWHQGLDLYGYDDDRLLKGFEYTARYNLGEDVPFAETLDRTGKYHHTIISTNGRGGFRAVYEEAYNHYVNRMGVPAPFTQRAAEKIRPEGSGGPGADHVGFGTLLFTRPVANGATQSQNAPASPGGVIAHGSPKENILTWVAPVGAKNYTVKRATGNDDYKIIARNLTAATFADTKVKSGEIYRYVVSASNSAGESPGSFPVSICAGLPSAWAHQDIGAVSAPGDASFDGDRFTLEGAGADIGGTNDQFQSAFTPLNGDSVMVARWVPQTSSQFSKFGLMMRETSAADAANVALLISPESGRNVEAPGWQAQLTVREATGAASAVRATSEDFSGPMVTFGRLTGGCWLKLERSGNTFTGSISADGKTWTQVGAATVVLKHKLLAGLPVCSRLSGITTTAMFDNVTVTDSAAKINSPVENQIESPDGKVAVKFFLQNGGVPAYTITYLDKPIVLESRLGLLPDFTNGFEIGKISKGGHQGEWTQVYGERKIVPDNYRELNVDLKQASGRRLRLTFRAYNEGAAFRYSFPKQKTPEFHFTGEQSEFHFPENTFGYEEHGTEGEYQRAKISDIEPWCERPLTLEYASGLFASLCEADNENYPRMLLSVLDGTSDTLVSTLGGTTSNTANDPSTGDPTATLPAGGSTPWRMFVVGEKPGDLLERNYLMLNLNPPLALKDVSWIKPGKIMRDTTLTTTNSKAIIDFAATAGLQYVLLDSGWYGSENADTGDATQPRAGRTRFGNPPQPMDIPGIIRYGREKNVGLILYVDRRQMKKQRDILFPLYEKWGVKGVKIGFVDVGPQAETAWITETIKKAAEHHLLLNIHDGHRPTGFARTYPNLLTVEGIRGNEHFPTAEHNCTVPFTRYVAGSADYTVCYYDRRLENTHAQQLAMAVISYSPLQSIFWYDRPDMYHGEPEVEFFQQVPTVWDDTKVINGEIGKFATIARRSGDDWFIGTINDNEPRELKLPLNFLNAGKNYVAHIYSDDNSIPTRTHVAVETRPVDSLATLDVPLQAAGGQAVWITPAQNH